MYHLYTDHTHNLEFLAFLHNATWSYFVCILHIVSLVIQEVHLSALRESVIIIVSI